MNNLKGLLAEPEFWMYYHQGTDQGGLDENLIEQYGERAPYQSEEVEFKPFVLSLPCLGTYTFELEIYLDFYSVNAHFRVRDDETHYQIGWWDFGRWHPFGLHWDELTRIRDYWAEHPGEIPIPVDAAFLLLAKFVGIGQSELDRVPTRKKEVESAYERLKVELTAQQKDELSSCTFLLPSEEDYDWSAHPDLGAVFGGKYPCYSLRNESHVSGEEGLFPFEPMKRLLEELEKAT